MKKKIVKLKPGYYDPADYIMVHKDHYNELLEASRTRITHLPYEIDPKGIVTSQAKPGEQP